MKKYTKIRQKRNTEINKYTVKYGVKEERFVAAAKVAVILTTKFFTKINHS